MGGPKNQNMAIVSHYSDIGNIFHIFAKEVLAIWEVYSEQGLSHKNTTIVLKNYKDDVVNRWRVALLKSLFKNVLIGGFDKKDRYRVIIDILHDKHNKWMFDPFVFKKIPKSPSCIEMAGRVKKSQNTYGIVAAQVGFVYRKHNRMLFDHATKQPAHLVLGEKLEKKGIPFIAVDLDNASFAQQAGFLKDVEVLVAVHGAAFTNMFLLPKNAAVFEVSFRRYWFCDPVCERHVTGECDYKKDCFNRKDPEKNLYYHKADYHNMSQLFDIGYQEILLEDANGYFKTAEESDYNPINLRNLFVDTDAVVAQILARFRRNLKAL